MSSKKKADKKLRQPEGGDAMPMQSAEANTLIMQQLLNLTRQMNDIQTGGGGGGYSDNGNNSNKTKKKKSKGKKDRSPEPFDEDKEDDEEEEYYPENQSPRNNINNNINNSSNNRGNNNRNNGNSSNNTINNNNINNNNQMKNNRNANNNDDGWEDDYQEPKRQIRFQESNDYDDDPRDRRSDRGERSDGYSDDYGNDYGYNNNGGNSKKPSPPSNKGGYNNNNGKKLSYSQTQVYETKIQELEDKLASVEHAMQVANSSHGETIMSLKDQLTLNEDAIFRSQSECLRLKGEKAFLDVEIETLKKKLITMETHYRKFENNLQTEFQTELSRLNGMNTLKQADKTGLVSEYEVKISKISAELRSRTQDLHRMEAHLSNVEGERKELEIKNGQLESRFRLVQSTNDQLENRMRQIEAERSEITNEYKLLKNNFRDLDVEFKAMSKKAAAFKAERDVLFVQVEMLEDKNGGNLSQFKTDLTATTSKLTEANNRANNLEKSLNFAMKELKTAREKLAGGTGIGAAGTEFIDALNRASDSTVNSVLSTSFQSPSLQPSRPLGDKASSLQSSPRGYNSLNTVNSTDSVMNGSNSNNYNNNNIAAFSPAGQSASNYQTTSLKLPSMGANNKLNLDSIPLPSHLMANSSNSNSSNMHLSTLSMAQIAANKMNPHSTTFHQSFSDHDSQRSGANSNAASGPPPKVFPEKVSVRDSILKANPTNGPANSMKTVAQPISFEPPNSSSKSNSPRSNISNTAIAEETSDSETSSGAALPRFSKPEDYLDFEKIQYSMTTRKNAQDILKELTSKKKSTKKEINAWIEQFKADNGRDANRQEKEAVVGPKFEVYNKLGFIISKIEAKLKDDSLK